MSEWEIIEEVKENASIKVIGVGGGGGNVFNTWWSQV